MEYVQHISENISETVSVEKMFDSLFAFLGSVRFNQWFGSDAQVRLTETSLVFAVKNQFCIDWIRSNLLRKIEEFSQTIFGKNYPVVFEILKPVEPLSTRSTVSVKTVVPSIAKELVWDDVASAPHFFGQQTFAFHSECAPPINRNLSHGVSISTSNRQNSPIQSISKRTAVRPTKNGRAFATLDTFAEGLSNRLAFRAADLAVHRPGEINPIYLFGPTSVGKTHLLEGIWSATRRRKNVNGDANENKLPLYMTCEQFVSSYLDALPKAGFTRDKVNVFRDRFKNVSVFLLDDIQQFAGKGATQSEFLILLDQLLQRGVQMVFTSNKPLNELQGLRSEIMSRLESGMVCEIKQPERETSYKIFCNMVSSRKLPLGNDVCRMVASRLGTNARQLLGALNRLHAVYLSTGQTVTLTRAEEILSDLLRNVPCNVRLPDIEKAVCETFGVATESLHSKSRVQQIAAPRMAAMWLARKYTRSSLTEIGQYFGGRSHSTVVTAQRKVDEWVDADNTIHTDHFKIPIAEAIQKIENLLR